MMPVLFAAFVIVGVSLILALVDVYPLWTKGEQQYCVDYFAGRGSLDPARAQTLALQRYLESQIMDLEEVLFALTNVSSIFRE
jgi:hypothetical protein